VYHAIRILGAWVSCANVLSYRITSPHPDRIQWKKLLGAKCRTSHGTQFRMGSGETSFSSLWTRKHHRNITQATTAVVCARLEGCPRISWLSYPHESGYSYSTYQKAVKKQERRTWWVTEAHLGTKQTKNKFVTANDIRTTLGFAGNTWHHIVCGRSLVPPVCLSQPVEQLDEVVTSGNMVQHATWQENPR
jgi:hypothetical protein